MVPIGKKFFIASLLAFIVVAVLSQLSYFRIYSWEFHVPIVLTLFVVNFLQGLWILMISRFSKRMVLLVTVIFFAGQWWFFMWSVIFLLWKINGFAP